MVILRYRTHAYTYVFESCNCPIFNGFISFLLTQEKALVWVVQKFRLKRRLTLTCVFQIVFMLVSLQRRARKNTWRHSGEHVHSESQSDTASVLCECEEPEDELSSETLSDHDADAMGHLVTPELREGERSCIYGTPLPCLDVDCAPPLPGVENIVPEEDPHDLEIH